MLPAVAKPINILTSVKNCKNNARKMHFHGNFGEAAVKKMLLISQCVRVKYLSPPAGILENKSENRSKAQKV